jgi:hypothetical protein
LPELRCRLASKEMKRRSRLAAKVTSSIQEHHEDHLPDNLEPTVVVGTTATSMQEQHEQIYSLHFEDHNEMLDNAGCYFVYYKNQQTKNNYAYNETIENNNGRSCI